MKLNKKERAALRACACSHPKPGRKIRGILEEQDLRMWGPMFYYMMQNLYQKGLVERCVLVQYIDGEEIRSNAYNITAKGIEALKKYGNPA